MVLTDIPQVPKEGVCEGEDWGDNGLGIKYDPTTSAPQKSVDGGGEKREDGIIPKGPRGVLMEPMDEDYEIVRDACLKVRKYQNKMALAQKKSSEPQAHVVSIDVPAYIFAWNAEQNQLCAPSSDETTSPVAELR